jgi:hypothetical protein
VLIMRHNLPANLALISPTSGGRSVSVVRLRTKATEFILSPMLTAINTTNKHVIILWYVRFEVFTAGTMKSDVFWDMAPCSSCVNRRFGGTYRLHYQGRIFGELGTSVKGG